MHHPIEVRTASKLFHPQVLPSFRDKPDVIEVPHAHSSHHQRLIDSPRRVRTYTFGPPDRTRRGALLLIFYLLVDKGRNPIILDQPEENLDNQTI
jgi:hypothetical protein